MHGRRVLDPQRSFRYTESGLKRPVLMLLSSKLL